MIQTAKGFRSARTSSLAQLLTLVELVLILLDPEDPAPIGPWADPFG